MVTERRSPGRGVQQALLLKLAAVQRSSAQLPGCLRREARRGRSAAPERGSRAPAGTVILDRVAPESLDSQNYFATTLFPIHQN